MKELLTQTRAALMATLILGAVCCGLYPLAVYGIAQVAFPARANGSLITDAHGNALGSEWIGQGFHSERYFHPRPSAAGNGYDAASSSGSNLGPTSQKLNDAIKERVAAYRAENGMKDNESVPADAVTASASGLDPHISPRNAEIQIKRVARVRGLSVQTVNELVRQHAVRPDFGILGDPGVNVLLLNLALDSLDSKASGHGPKSD